MAAHKSYDQLLEENALLRQQVTEVTDTLEAIRNGEIDALVVQGKNGHELYTLQSADHTYRMFIEKMSEGAVTLNPDGIILYCNSSFTAMTGSPAATVVSELFENFVDPADRESFRQMIVNGWQADIKGEIHLADRRSTPVQLSITRLRMDEGVSLSIIVTDLTSQKEILKQVRVKNEQLNEMNTALEMSNHDLQQFASVASHDLQEPLRKIQIFSFFLRDKFYNDLTSGAREYVDKILSSASRMKVLIIDILNYSRLSSDDNEYSLTDLKAVIREVVEDLELTIAEKHAVINVHDMPSVEINRGQIRQMFQNLISNALKFSRTDSIPTIEIFCRGEYDGVEADPANPYCHLHVIDNGIGFEEKYAKNIFNLFEKLHSKDEYEGTGIGLAITKKIVEKHHGSIHVKSTLGKGTEFIISLPIHQQKK